MAGNKVVIFYTENEGTKNESVHFKLVDIEQDWKIIIAFAFKVNRIIFLSLLSILHYQYWYIILTLKTHKYSSNTSAKWYIREYVVQVYEQIRDSIVVSIPACHAGDPGSIPGRGAFFLFSLFESIR
jgi:hypothetical protein